jgi:hypothetical protein
MSIQSQTRACFALLPSPFQGASAWGPCGEALAARGQAANVIDLREAFADVDASYDSVARAAAARIGEGAILVAHSGAGGLAPAVQAAAGDRVQAVIFVDALMPHPGRSWFDTAPAALTARLRADARDGRVPPWPAWLPEGALARLLPAPSMRERFIADAPVAPLTYLQAPAPALAAWPPRLGCAYIQLSDGYQAEAGMARSLGWPVERLDLNHLAILTAPETVGEAIIDLVDRLLAPYWGTADVSRDTPTLSPNGPVRNASH